MHAGMFTYVTMSNHLTWHLRFQLSREQADDAAATIDKLTASGKDFCAQMQSQLDQALQASGHIAVPAASHASTSSPRDYIANLPQLLSVSMLNLGRKTNSDAS